MSRLVLRLILPRRILGILITSYGASLGYIPVFVQYTIFLRIALIPNLSSVGSLMVPSEVASINDPNAGVIGILHLIVFLRDF